MVINDAIISIIVDEIIFLNTIKARINHRNGWPPIVRDIVMGNSDKQMELIADLDNAKYKIINLQHKNKALEDRIQELENEKNKQESTATESTILDAG